MKAERAESKNLETGVRALPPLGRAAVRSRRSPVLAFLLLVILSPGTRLAAQEKKAAAPPISDNSFLIEEAYNQETGVVQHISTFYRERGGAWSYTFTQEWPMPGPRHQLSFTLPVAAVTQSGTRETGVGDLALNYRFQALGLDEGGRAAFAPRLTWLAPAGSYKRGLGAGGAGLQINLPLSVAWSDHLVTHWNAGATYTPSARNAAGDKSRSRAVNLGQSIVWLAHPRFNVLLETSWTWSEDVSGPGLSEGSREFFLNPGVRWAHNFANGLQIVPGLAFPIGVGPSAGERGVFVYLSFEHPFKKQSEPMKSELRRTK